MSEDLIIRIAICLAFGFAAALVDYAASRWARAAWCDEDDDGECEPSGLWSR